MISTSVKFTNFGSDQSKVNNLLDVFRCYQEAVVNSPSSFWCSNIQTHSPSFVYMIIGVANMFPISF